MLYYITYNNIISCIILYITLYIMIWFIILYYIVWCGIIDLHCDIFGQVAIESNSVQPLKPGFGLTLSTRSALIVLRFL